MCYHFAIKAEKYEIEQRYNAAFEDGVEFNPDDADLQSVSKHNGTY